MSQSSITRFAGQVMHWLVNATFLVKVPMVRTEAVLEFLLSVPASLSRRGVDGSAMATITLNILIYSCGIPLILATPPLFVSACNNTLDMLHMNGADTRWLFGLPWSP